MVRRKVAGRLGEAMKRNTHVHRAGRRARFEIGRLVPPRRYPGIPGRIHYNDFMFTERSAAEAASYRERALNVMSLMEESMMAAGRTFDDVESWLDFGCGYGRVVRFLVERVPPERISVCDVVTEGVDFCVNEFGVRPIRSGADLGTLKLGSSDFIYAISVISHLNERNSIAMLRLLGGSLTEGGVALFTTHGRYSLDNPGLYGAEYEERKDAIADEVERRGMAFLPYPFVSGDHYGMAWHSREFIERTMQAVHEGRMRLLLFTERGLDDHQDVFAFQRVR
jgi:SAM-dependent methyltransferase